MKTAFNNQLSFFSNPLFRFRQNFLCGLLLLSSFCAYAKDPQDQQLPSSPQLAVDQMRAAAQNPLSPTFSFPIKYVLHGEADRGNVSVLSFQPVMPIAFKNWNLINQLSLNFLDTPGGVTGVPELPSLYSKSSAVGLADLNFTSLISPAHTGNTHWGLGAALTFPSDYPSRELGSGKFSAGPAAAVLTQINNWTLGFQGSQVWSVIGSQGRNNISQFQIKPIINYNLNNGWYLASNTTIHANWHAAGSQEWTVPIGGGLGKTFALGDQIINTRLEGYYNIVKPDQAANWSMAVTLQFMFPE